MAREDERVMEKFVARGTGELAGRDLQRANAPQLGNSLLESQITRSREDNSRKQSNLIKELANRSKAPRAQAPQGGGAINQPIGMIRSLANKGIPGSAAFELATADGGKAFTGVDDFRTFLADNPQFKNNLGFAGIEGIEGLPKELRRQIEQLLTGSPTLPSLSLTDSSKALGQTGNILSELQGIGVGKGSASANSFLEAQALRKAEEDNKVLKALKAKAIDPFTSVKARGARGFN